MDELEVVDDMIPSDSVSAAVSPPVTSRGGDELNRLSGHIKYRYFYKDGLLYFMQ